MNYCVSEDTITFIKTIQITEEIETSKGTVKFIDCKIFKGVQIEVEAAVTITRCVIDTSCRIGSDISDCKYLMRILTISGNQSEVFKFNYVTIIGRIRAIASVGDSKVIITNSDRNPLNISGREFGILNCGTLFIHSYCDLVINSIGMAAICCRQGSNFTFNNKTNLMLNLTCRGIETEGETKIVSDDEKFRIWSNFTTEVWFSQTHSILNNCRFRGIGNIKDFSEIEINRFSRESEQLTEVEIRIDPIERCFFYPLKIEKGRNCSEGRIINYSDQSQTIYRDDGTIVLKPFAMINLENTVLQANPKIIVEKSVEITNSVIKNSIVTFSSLLIVDDSIIVNAEIEISKPTKGAIIKDSEL